MKRIVTLLFLAVLTGSFLFGASVPKASASFNQNSIIDDTVFDDYNAMSAAQIDAFLNSFPNSCISPNSGFRAIDPTGYNPTNGYQYGGFVTAGQVLYDAGQAYGLNPQVMLATLQKEQSLVAGGANYCNNGDQHKYAAAVGYGCPDSGTTYSYDNVNLYQRNGVTVTSTGTTCVNSASKAGFTQQVIRGAWLLKFGEQRAEGNIGWAVIKGNWNNSDDPQSCYGGPMTQGSYQRCPSGARTYYDGYTSIDNTSVHIDNGATAALYWYTPHFHGNQNFAALFESYFGPLIGSYLVRTVNDSTVFLLSGTTRYPIADLNVLADFGMLGGIKFVSQEYVDGYTNGPLLGHMVAGSDGTLYFIDAGIKLPFTSCSMVAEYGFSCGSVITLTAPQLNKFATGPAVTSVYATTTGKKFYVSGGQKHEIFDQQSQTEAGITAGPNVLLEGGISYLPYGTPVIRNGVVATSRSDGRTYLYDTNRFLALNIDIRDLGAIRNLPHSSLDEASIPIGQKTTGFTGFMADGSSNRYALLDSGKVALTAPSTWTATYTTASSQLLSALANSTEPLNNQLVKKASNSTVYYVTGAQKRPITSWDDLIGLHATPFGINTLPDTELNAIPDGSVMYAPGRLVKSANSSTVYVVKSANELFPISSFTYPSELGLSFSILTMSQADLSTYTVLPLLQSKILCGSTYYVGNLGQVFALSSAQLTQYGLSSSDFTNVTNACLNAPVSSRSLDNFIRISNGTIYKVENGTKRAITSYGAYQANGGNGQNTIQVSDYFAGLIAPGANISQ